MKISYHYHGKKDSRIISAFFIQTPSTLPPTRQLKIIAHWTMVTEGCEIWKHLIGLYRIHNLCPRKGDTYFTLLTRSWLSLCDQIWVIFYFISQTVHEDHPII